jgi:hypothetical protein
LKKDLLSKDSTINEQPLDNTNILVSRRKCSDLYDLYPSIGFVLGTTTLYIKPKGYLYSLATQQDCFIGISSLPDSLNQYRLGTIFLRSFYLGLDFEQDLVLMGINKGREDSHAEILGKSENPLLPKNGLGVGWWILTFILMLVGIGGFIYWRQRKIEKERNVTFKSGSKRE